MMRALGLPGLEFDNWSAIQEAETKKNDSKQPVSDNDSGAQTARAAAAVAAVAKKQASPVTVTALNAPTVTRVKKQQKPKAPQPRKYTKPVMVRNQFIDDEAEEDNRAFVSETDEEEDATSDDGGNTEATDDGVDDEIVETTKTMKPPTRSGKNRHAKQQYTRHSTVTSSLESKSRADSNVESAKRKRASVSNSHDGDSKRRRDDRYSSQQQKQQQQSTNDQQTLQKDNSELSVHTDDDIAWVEEEMFQNQVADEERDELILKLDTQTHPLAVASTVNSALNDVNNLRNAWSLMIRFDFDLYVQALQCSDPEQILALRKQFHMLHLYMQMIVAYYQENNVNCNLPKASITRLDELVKKEQEYRDEADIQLDEEQLSKLRSSGDVNTMIWLMDHEVHQLMVLLRKPKFLVGQSQPMASNMKLRNMILVQELNTEMYNKYVTDRFQYMNTNAQKRKIHMNGFFVISLSPNYTSQFQTFHDRSGMLLLQIQPWIEKYIFHGKSIPKQYHVFMNCVLTVDCKHYVTLTPLTLEELQQMEAITKPTKPCDPSNSKRVSPGSLLNAHYDPNGVLALANIGYIELQPERRLINVKVYIVSTFSTIPT